jgi:hypothetical protein
MMSAERLSAVLKIQAATLFFGLPALVFVLRPPGWPWDPGHLKYEWMIVGTYMALGVFLHEASKKPLEHGLFYEFVIWGAYAAHATIMLVEALADFKTEKHHLMPYGDIPGLYVLAIMLWWAKKEAGVKQP